MNERVRAQNKTSGTPPQVTQANSSLLHQDQFNDELSESVGSNSSISRESGGIQPKTIRRSLNWENITVEAPFRGNGMSLPGGIQRQQEEPGIVSGDQISADSAQKSPFKLSNSTIFTYEPAQKPLIARPPFKGRNIPIKAPASSAWILMKDGSIQNVELKELAGLARVGDELMITLLEDKKQVIKRGQVVALGGDLPDAELTSLIDRRPPIKKYNEPSDKITKQLEELKNQLQSAYINAENFEILQNKWLELMMDIGRRIKPPDKKNIKGKEYEIGEKYTPRGPAEALMQGSWREEYNNLVEKWRKVQWELAKRRYEGMKKNPQTTVLGDWERYQHYMAERGLGVQGDMTFEQWTKLSKRKEPSGFTRKPGEGINDVNLKWGNPQSPAYGHALENHGSKIDAFQLQDRARKTRKPQGHWYDNKLIVEAEQLAPLKPGEHIINMGKPVGNVYFPDGTVLKNVMIVKVIREKNLTLITAYPFC